MFLLDQSPGRIAFVNGRDHLFFSGYSYLGMSHIEEFTTLVKEGMDIYGVLHPSSRISNTQLNVFSQMESALSLANSQEETVTYSSGFLAGRAVVDWVAAQSARKFIAPGTHPALHSSNALLLEADWQEQLLSIIVHERNDIILLCDSVNPLTASITSFEFLKNIPVDNKVLCVIDDSHGMGLLGERGEGISCMLPKCPNVEYILTYSLSKAFNITGGGVSCSKKIAQLLRALPYYAASTAMAPALCYAFINGQSLYDKQRQRLIENINYLHDHLPYQQQVHSHPKLPITVLDARYDQEYFAAHEIIISSFSYPDPTGTKVNRVVLNALHTYDDIERLSKVLAKRSL